MFSIGTLIKSARLNNIWTERRITFELLCNLIEHDIISDIYKINDNPLHTMVERRQQAWFWNNAEFRTSAALPFLNSTSKKKMKERLFAKGALYKYNIITHFYTIRSVAWVMTACWMLRSILTYFWRNLNMFNIFYFSKSTSIDTQYSSLWDTLEKMLFTKYLIKWKRIDRISWKISVLL